MANRKRKRASDSDADQALPRYKKISPRQLSFLDLPAELRNQIYALALIHDPDLPRNTKHLSALPHYQSKFVQSNSQTKDDHTFQYKSGRRFVGGKLVFKNIPGFITGSITYINIALLMTCKQIHGEAKPLMFELNTFTADFEALGTLSGYNQKSRQALGGMGFWKLLVKVVQPLWEHIKHLEMRWYVSNLAFGDGGVLKNAILLFKASGIQLRSLDWTAGNFMLSSPVAGAPFSYKFQHLKIDGPIRLGVIAYAGVDYRLLVKQQERSRAVLERLKGKRVRPLALLAS